jgi:zinc protease
MPKQSACFRFIMIILSFMHAKPLVSINQPLIHKKILNNGLTILVRETKRSPNVSIQMHYHVGSKDETSNERGLAHLLEHMVFKGTKILSETDIRALTNKLSGWHNAFTSADTTQYVFELPKRHWHEALPILADCMINCIFKQDLLNSEFKAVLQELKLYRDNFEQSLEESLISTIFDDHPYHYPVIGFKHDIWDITNKELLKFYRKHYLPNNAVLVIVGDVDAHDVFTKAAKAFGAIKGKKNYTKKQHHHTRDIGSKTITLYRGSQPPLLKLAFAIPGLKSGKSSIAHLVNTLLTGGKHSRLYQRLIIKEQSAHTVKGWVFELFDHGILFITIHPQSADHIEPIIKTINQEITQLAHNGPTINELTEVSSCFRIRYYEQLEENYYHACALGNAFLATGNEYQAYKKLPEDINQLTQQVNHFVKNYIRPSVMHRGILLPLAPEEHAHWSMIQQESDIQDATILAQRVRTSTIEPIQYANTITAIPSKPCNPCIPEKHTLSNGLSLYTVHDNTVPTIALTISLAANKYYDSLTLPGLYRFMTSALTHGTKNYTSAEFSQQLALLGSSLSITPGTISLFMLKEHVRETLHLLNDILQNPRFEYNDIEIVRAQLITEYKEHNGDPNHIRSMMILKTIYPNHPWSTQALISNHSLNMITLKDIIDCYNKFITPQGASIFISGDLSNISMRDLINETLGSWKGSTITPIIYPTLKQITNQELTHTINSDQVYCALIGRSVERKHPDFDKLVLAGHIIAGDAHARLFKLREQTGLFYLIGGSFVTFSGTEPGAIVIETTVSPDQYEHALDLITKTLTESINTITQQELIQAKETIKNHMMCAYSTNKSTVNRLAYLHENGLPFDHYITRTQHIDAITLDDIQQAAQKFVNNDALMRIKVGRI